MTAGASPSVSVCSRGRGTCATGGGCPCWAAGDAGALKGGRRVSAVGLWEGGDVGLRAPADCGAGSARLSASCADADGRGSEPAQQPWPSPAPGAAGQFCAVVGTSLPIFLRVLSWTASGSSCGRPVSGLMALLPLPRAAVLPPRREVTSPSRHRAASYIAILLGRVLGDAGGFARPPPAASPGDCCRPFRSPLGFGCFEGGREVREPHHCGHFFFPLSFLFALLFNEPTLGDLERRSCSFAVTYLPASAPYSAEGINLCSRRGARPAARCRRHNSRRGGRCLAEVAGWTSPLGAVMDGRPGGVGGGSREKSPVTTGDKLLNYSPFNLGRGKPKQTCRE